MKIEHSSSHIIGLKLGLGILSRFGSQNSRPEDKIHRQEHDGFHYETSDPVDKGLIGAPQALI